MTDTGHDPIQRYAHQWRNDPPVPADNGKWVLFTDHEAAVRAAVEAERDRIRKGVEALPCHVIGHHDESMCSTTLGRVLAVIDPAPQDGPPLCDKCGHAKHTGFMRVSCSGGCQGCMAPWPAAPQDEKGESND